MRALRKGASFSLCRRFLGTRNKIPSFFAAYIE